MPKEISTEELLLLAQEGAKVTTPEKVNQFQQDMLTQVKSLVAAQAAQALRGQEAVAAAINALTQALAAKKNVDMAPVLSVLDDIRKNGQATPEPKLPYVFTVHRDRKGLLTRVDATPASNKE